MNAQLGPVTYAFEATASAPVQEEDWFIREEDRVEPFRKGRLFQVTAVDVEYTREDVLTGDVEDESSGWSATATVSGFIVTGGVTGTRPTRRTFAEDDAPEKLREVIDRLHPEKRA